LLQNSNPIFETVLIDKNLKYLANQLDAIFKEALWGGNKEILSDISERIYMFHYSILEDMQILRSKLIPKIRSQLDESNDSEKRRKEIIRKIKLKKIEVEGAVLIGRHCQIEDGVRLADCCIDNFTRIGKNTVVENSAVMDRAIIGEDAEIIESIVGRHVAIDSSQKKPTKMSAVSVVADDVTLEEGCVLVSSKVYPHQRVRGVFQNQTLISN